MHRQRRVRTLMAAVATAAAVVAAGCGSDTDGSPFSRKQQDGPEFPTQTRSLPEGDLAGRAIQINDLPVGWAVHHDTDGDDDDDFNECYDPEEEQPLYDKADAEIEVAYRNSTTGELVAETLISYATSNWAPEAFDLTLSLTRRCPVDDEGTLSELSFPRYGEQSAAFELRFTEAPNTPRIPMYLVFVRAGNYNLGLVYFSNSGQLNADRIGTFVELALAKLGAPQ